MKIFVGFLGCENTRLFAFEVYWPLDKEKEWILDESTYKKLFWSLKRAFSFFFFQVSGISFAFDGEKPAGQRIDPAYIKIGDEYLNPERTYRMVTKAYLANGKDGYDVLAKCNQVCELYGGMGCRVFKRGTQN